MLHVKWSPQDHSCRLLSLHQHFYQHTNKWGQTAVHQYLTDEHEMCCCLCERHGDFLLQFAIIDFKTKPRCFGWFFFFFSVCFFGSLVVLVWFPKWTAMCKPGKSHLFLYPNYLFPRLLPNHSLQDWFSFGQEPDPNSHGEWRHVLPQALARRCQQARLPGILKATPREAEMHMLRRRSFPLGSIAFPRKGHSVLHHL